MTYGYVTQGVNGAGYYKARNWAGTDGNHQDEHAYNVAINESFFPTVKYGWGGSARYEASMLSFCPGIPRTWTDDTIPLINCATIKIDGDLVQTKFNLGVFAGEFKESYVMLSGLVTKLARSIALIRRGNYSGALRILADPRSSLSGTAANSYMVVHFGLIPLCKDIEAVYNMMRSSYSPVARVRRHCVYKDGAKVSLNGVQWEWSKRAVTEVRGVVDLSLSLYDRLGLYDVATVAWELTRLSWLVDWVIPIGNFLSAVNASNRTQGSSFAMTRYSYELIDRPTKIDPYLTIEGFDGASFKKVTDTNLSRTIMTELPWTFPTISNPLGDNLSRWTTAAALLRQTAGR